MGSGADRGVVLMGPGGGCEVLARVLYARRDAASAGRRRRRCALPLSPSGDLGRFIVHFPPVSRIGWKMEPAAATVLCNSCFSVRRLPVLVFLSSRVSRPIDRNPFAERLSAVAAN